MQIAAMRPQYLTRDEVPAELVEKEREIAEQTSREEGKPEQAIPKIAEGRLNGFFKDVVLLEQPSVTENKQSVKAVLDEAGTTVSGSPASRSAPERLTVRYPSTPTDLPHGRSTECPATSESC